VRIDCEAQPVSAETLALAALVLVALGLGLVAAVTFSLSTTRMPAILGWRIAAFASSADGFKSVVAVAVPAAKCKCNS
jgi:hypothetical protein